MTEQLIRCRDVVVEYGRGDALVRALRVHDLPVRRGERVALVGRSGSGKTTLLHVMAGLIQPTDGLVEWEGRPMSTLDAAARGRARAAGIGLVFQSPNLFPHLTAFENVAFARCVSHAGAQGPGPLDLLALVGLEAKADSLPGELSGGEAQRVAIARALAQRPQLLLCDEPTGHLDSDTGGRVLDLVDALQAEFGFSLVTATHDSDVAARFAREVGLEDGQIVREGVFR